MVVSLGDVPVFTGEVWIPADDGGGTLPTAFRVAFAGVEDFDSSFEGSLRGDGELLRGGSFVLTKASLWPICAFRRGRVGALSADLWKLLSMECLFPLPALELEELCALAFVSLRLMMFTALSSD